MFQEFRVKLNQYPIPVGAVTALILVIIGMTVWHSSRGRDSFSHYADYSSDDGETWYRDVVQTTPFQKHGKEVVRAMIFSCDGGKTTFVGYLLRTAPSMTPVSSESTTRDSTPRPPFEGYSQGMQVKKPGAGNEWVRIPAGVPKPGAEHERDAYESIVSVKCPAGDGIPMLMSR